MFHNDLFSFLDMFSYLNTIICDKVLNEKRVVVIFKMFLFDLKHFTKLF